MSSSAKAGDSPRVSAGLAARMQAMQMNSSSSVGSNEETPVPGGSTGTKSPRVSGKVSPGVAARLKAMNSGSSAGGGEAGGEEQEKECPPHSPALASSGSSSSPRTSPGLAARMQVG